MKSRLLFTVLSLGLLALLAMPARVAAQDEHPQEAKHIHGYSVLDTFTGADGAFPLGNVIRDREGNLYGTTFNGGDLSACNGSGCGTVFKVDKSGKETVLYSFTGGTDGAYPATGLLRDEAGNLYGTTHGGGDITVPACSFNPGCGVVFKVEPTGKETVLYAFAGGADGLGPPAGLVRDEEGNLYGTTVIGGDLSGVCPGFPAPGCGVVFKVEPTGKETVLYTFTGLADGYAPYGDLLRDEAGNLYGAASNGGDVSGFCGDVVLNKTGFLGCGTIFKLDRTGKFTVLHTFNGADGGPFPDGWLVRDDEGSLYGMSGNGGDLSECSGLGCGVVFKVDRRGKETVLYSFTGGADGAETFAGVVRDDVGNLYGTTYFGGDFSGSLCSSAGCGVVFKLDRAGKETVLYTFTGSTDGANPNADLLPDDLGNLYGTASDAGDLSCSPPYGCGVLFKINPHHCGEGDKSNYRPRVVLPENIRELFQQRLRFSKFGARPVGPR
jgi:uncharacterized repeat protein (TIGR03803 family)